MVLPFFRIVASLFDPVKELVSVCLLSGAAALGRLPTREKKSPSEIHHPSFRGAPKGGEKGGYLQPLFISLEAAEK